jgi:hypothetical protein
MPSRHHKSRRSRRSPSSATSYSSSSYTSPSPRKSRHRHRSKSKSRPHNKSKEEKWPLTPAFTIAPLPRPATPPRAAPTTNYNRGDRYATIPNASYTPEARIHEGVEIIQPSNPKTGYKNYDTRFVLPPDLTIPLPTTLRTFNICWDDNIRHRGIVLPFGQYRDALLKYHNTMPAEGSYPYPDLMEALKLKRLMDDSPSPKRVDNTTISTEIRPTTQPTTPTTMSPISISPPTANAPDSKAE